MCADESMGVSPPGRVEHAEDVELSLTDWPHQRKRERDASLNMTGATVARLLSSMGSTAGETVTAGHASLTTRPGVCSTDVSLVLMALIWRVNFSVVKFDDAGRSVAYNGMRVSLARVV
jgi:hypothetical protein